VSCSIRWISPTTRGSRRLEHGRAARGPGAPDRPSDDRARGADDEEYRGCRFDAIMSSDRRRQRAATVHGAGGARLPVVDADCMGRAFPEAQIRARDPRPDITRSRSPTCGQRAHRGARRHLEVDGAPVAHGVRRVGSNPSTSRRPHREGSQGVRHPVLDHQAIRLARPCSRRRAHRDPVLAVIRPSAASWSSGQDPRRRPAHDEGFLRGTAKLDASTTSAAPASSSPSRTSSRSGGGGLDGRPA